MRRAPLVPVVLAAGGILLAPATAHAAAPRSVDITWHNNTDCRLVQVTKVVDYGRWAIDPAGEIPAYGTDHFRTESDGWTTGTEGTVVWRAADCSVSGQTVRFHWDNPYYGGNSYDFGGSSGGFNHSYTGGSGDNAGVGVDVSKRFQPPSPAHRPLTDSQASAAGAPRGGAK
ncbi:hypothetical protein [Streptosporangium sp. NPDC004631]